jgi:hypothetical protein
MGNSTWTAASYARYSHTTLKGRSTNEVFTQRSVNPHMDPMKITMRESRDSDENPESTAIIIGLDETGSMGVCLDAAIRGLGSLVNELYTRKPVTDPHLMFIGVGDITCDSGPLQVSQFEADIRIAEQLQNIWLERRGGGNDSESYTLPWVFAAMKTSIDCWEKRQKKGYIFTVGDEPPPTTLRASHLASVGLTVDHDISSEEALRMACEKYHVFHLMAEQGDYMKSNHDEVVTKWTNLIGERAIPLNNVQRLPEVIVSQIQFCEGMDRDEIIASWSGDAASAVSHSLKINLR